MPETRKNFTIEEKNKLRKIIQITYQHIILNLKRTLADNDTKEKAWSEICEKFNFDASNERHVNTLCISFNFFYNVLT